MRTIPVYGTHLFVPLTFGRRYSRSRKLKILLVFFSLIRTFVDMITYPIAKINLGLNVVEKRSDGYHNLQTVFYPVPVKDALEVQEMDEGFPSEVDCDLKVTNIVIEGDEQRNLVVRAYRLLKEDFPTLPRIHTHLWKGIPTQAGMGGGSSDCAFFVASRPAYAEGIGERLQPIALDLSGWHIAVVRPDIPVPTKEAFSRIRPHYPQMNCREAVMLPVETWKETLVNDFEESVFALHPEIGAVKDELYKMGATYAAMSGSGSALFGLFKERPAAVEQAFPDMFKQLLVL